LTLSQTQLQQACALADGEAQNGYTPHACLRKARQLILAAGTRWPQNGSCTATQNSRPACRGRQADCINHTLLTQPLVHSHGQQAGLLGAPLIGRF